MRVASEWWLRCALAVAAVLAAVALFRLSGSTFGAAAYTDCDNLAGACLRTRQIYALRGIGLVAAGLALGCLWIAASAFWRRTRRWHAAALCLAFALLAGAVAADPVHHLDNRHHGWLSAPSGF
jgi:hypothetical protein